MNWPADRFYWSVIESAPGAKAGPLPVGLLSIFEEDVPFAVDELWAVCAPISDHRLIVCAAKREELAAITSATTLTPASAPDLCVSVDCAALNLLIGEFEPKAARKARYKNQSLLAAGLVLACSLVGIGLERRARALDAESRSTMAATHTIIASLSTSLGWNSDALAMELKNRKESIAPDVKPPEDASLAIASLISRWPTSIPSKPQLISATGEAASISVTVPGDPAAFLKALTPPEGWKLEEPRLASVDATTRISLELRRRP